MRVKTVILILGVLLFRGGIAHATITDVCDGDFFIGVGDYYDSLYVWNNANVLMAGGEVEFLYSHNSGYFNFSGGLLSFALRTDDNSIVEMTGGTVGVSIELYDYSIMYLSGGNIDSPVSIYDDAVLHVYGKDFEYTPGGGYGFGWLSGLWADDTSFSILFRNLPESFPPSSSVILHEIPEPCTIGLFGLGLFFLRKRNKTLCR